MMMRALRRAARVSKRLALRLRLSRLRHATWPFHDRYILEENPQVTVFTAHPEHFEPSQRKIGLACPVRSLAEPRQHRVTVSLILTARNEQESARQTIHSLLSQSRLPDEIIVTDTGSIDGTMDVLRELAAESPVPIQVIVVQNANIAQGRNTAITRARGSVIAVTDFGCQPAVQWLDSLVAPFEIDPQNQVTAGRYQLPASSSQAERYPFWPTLDEINPQSYLPPGGSMAFTRQAWANVGGYPEWLTLTGEDTYFDLELRRTTRRWAFAPEAVVTWQAPLTSLGWWCKAGYWAAGDGEIGTNARTYQRALRQIGFLFFLPLACAFLFLLATITRSTGLALIAFVFGLLWFVRLQSRARQVGYSPVLELGVRLAMVRGYIKGARRRAVVDARRWQTVRGIMVILSGVPIDDTGGGARGTQIALELLRRQFLVVFINQFPKYEANLADVLLRHPNLLVFPRVKFSLDAFTRQFGDLLREKPTGVLVEHPIPDFLPVVRELRQHGGRVLYDLIDDWSTSLGARWYSPETEKELISIADALLATAPSLQARMEEVSGRQVMLLPNAVNQYLFDPQRIYTRPPDLPTAPWTILYIGALWGEWFDWKLLVAIANRYPDSSVVLIGDYRWQCPDPPPNLSFLGLKPQRDLPAYLAHASVAIIPWKVNDITRSTSPLKLYEYLAMHKPVVVPDLPLLSDLPFVFCSPDGESFLHNVKVARHMQVGGETLASFLEQNSWQARVGSIVDIIQPQE